VRWEIADKDLVLNVEDNGPGLLNPGNVFVPFYTTKPGGSGIGLVLSRQVVETHGGSIELMNRSGTRGCRVKVVLPGVQLSAGAKNTSTVSSSSMP
jgi:nitrogen fixation/metabolism regulation signal transduction histidine kinase